MGRGRLVLLFVLICLTYGVIAAKRDLMKGIKVVW